MSTSSAACVRRPTTSARWPVSESGARSGERKLREVTVAPVGAPHRAYAKASSSSFAVSRLRKGGKSRRGAGPTREIASSAPGSSRALAGDFFAWPSHTVADDILRVPLRKVTMRACARLNFTYRVALLGCLWSGLLDFPAVAAQSTLEGATCPYSTASDDGCNGAPVGGNVQHLDFFTGYANQSGQSYAIRPPWNVAGVDYPVGISSARRNAGLKDPTSAPLPNGCSYLAPTHRVACTGVSNITFDGYDFGHTANGCTRLEFEADVGGAIVVTNSNFLADATNCGPNNLISVDNLNTVATSVTIKFNVLDANAEILGTSGVTDVVSLNTRNAALDIEYNACLHLHGRCINGGTSSSIVFAHNYCEGFSYVRGQALHSECTQFGDAGGPGASQFHSYNTMLQPANAGNEMTAPLYASSGGRGDVWARTQIDHNVIVGNAGVGVTWLAVVAWATYAKVDWSFNFFDPTGAAGGCITHESSPKIAREDFHSGSNINMRTGAPINRAGTC